ncbi:hypothetical protein L208DRAFT_1427949 [Tricholoma matsutake]|nr:hypothetical protein L208DRAFT_1427949 [Tricholoma matsutake 945]
MYAHFQAEYQPPGLAELPTVARDTHATNLIGRPIFFVSGQFTGQAVRAELREIQQADLGRKYARVDRRPLDPPPVVQLRLFTVFNPGSSQETEEEILDYDGIQTLGLLCTVDLFPVPPQNIARDSVTHKLVPFNQPPLPSPGPSHVKRSTDTPFTFVPNEYPAEQPSVELSPQPRHRTSGFPVPSPSAPDVIHCVNDFPITESSKVTHALVGATFVQPAIVDYQGQKSMMFVFADLAVKVEGNFILRYRVFDLFSKPCNHSGLAIQAECYGGSFRIYSTKEFPGLQASTELTKQLARWGVRLNTRETERKRRPGKKGKAPSTTPPYSGIGKRKSPNKADSDENGDD